MLQDAVRDTQPAHVRALRRRHVEQAEIAPAEIVRGLRRLILLGLLLELVVSIERMLFAFELFLIGELAAARGDAVLRLEVDRVGTCRLALRARRKHATRRARRVAAGDEAFEITLLGGGKITGHVRLPASQGRAGARPTRGRTLDRRGSSRSARLSG